MPSHHRVTARRHTDGWHLVIPDFGTIPTRSLATAEKTARAHIAANTGRPEDELVVTIQPKLDVRLGEAVQRAKTAQTELARLSATAATQSRQAAQALREAGLSNTDIAHVLGVSDQRVSQLFGKTGAKS